MSDDEHGSYELNVVGKAATMQEMWEKHLADPVKGREEANHFAARKHRLVALFGSAHCYSANVHADTNDLKQLVDSLMRLDQQSVSYYHTPSNHNPNPNQVGPAANFNPP